MGCGASKEATSAVANNNRGAPMLDKGGACVWASEKGQSITALLF